MIRHRPVIIVLEVLLQSHGVVRDVQHCVQVVRKHLDKRHRELSHHISQHKDEHIV